MTCQGLNLDLIVNLELVPAASLAEITDTTAHIVTIVATLVLGLWAYSRFLAQQITRPPIEFTVKGEPIGTIAHKRLVRITFRVRNGSTRECHVWLYWKMSGLRNRLNHLDERPKLPGQVKFNTIHQLAEYVEGTGPGAKDGETEGKGDQAALAPGPSRRDLRRMLKRWAQQERPKYENPPGCPPAEYLPVMGERTFIAAGVAQEYEFVTYVDLDYGIAMVLGLIIYMRSRSRLAWLMMPLARSFIDLTETETSIITTQHTVAGVVVLESTAWQTPEGPQSHG